MTDYALPLAQPWPAATPLDPRRYLAVMLAVTALFFLELAIGNAWVPLSDVVRAIVSGEASRSSWTTIVLQFRLPRAWAALVAGAAMGVSGLLLQTLCGNPLADPWVLGAVHGARLGVAVLVVVVGWWGNSILGALGSAADFSLAAAAFVGAAVLMTVVMSLARRVSPTTLLISGLMLGYASLGLISIVLHFTDDGQVRAFEAWDDGSFAGLRHTQLMVMTIATAAGIAMTAGIAKPLNAMTLGERYARSMGVAVVPIRRVALVITAVLAGAVTAFCGPIAFLGILAPHGARAWFRTADHRRLVWGVALTGAVVGLSADLITHLPWSRHFLHLNAVIGLFGAPLVVWTIVRRREFGIA